MIYNGNVNQIKMCEDKMWDINLTFLKCLFQNWHVSREHLTFSISILLTKNIFVGKKKFYLKCSQKFSKSCTLKGRMHSLRSFSGLVFFFFPLLIIWFPCKVVGIDNYAICNPVVFPVREIPDTFLPGLIITSQTLVAGGLSPGFLWLKPQTAVADRWLWKGLW